MCLTQSYYSMVIVYFMSMKLKFPQQFGSKKLKGSTCHPSRLVSLRSGGAICDLQIGTLNFFFFFWEYRYFFC